MQLDPLDRASHSNGGFLAFQPPEQAELHWFQVLAQIPLHESCQVSYWINIQSFSYGSPCIVEHLQFPRLGPRDDTIPPRRFDSLLGPLKRIEGEQLDPTVMCEDFFIISSGNHTHQWERLVQITTGGRGEDIPLSEYGDSLVWPRPHTSTSSKLLYMICMCQVTPECHATVAACQVRPHFLLLHCAPWSLHTTGDAPINLR